MVGVCVDSLEASSKMSEELKLSLPILVDAENRIAKAYGVYDQGNDIAWPAVFVIDDSGNIVWSEAAASYVYDSRPSVADILGKLDAIE